MKLSTAIGMFLLVFTTAIPGAPGSLAQDATAFAALRENGAVALMRHGDAPGGTGVPPGFKLNDCSTQRNLSAKGRLDATRTGQRLKAERVGVGKNSQLSMVPLPRHCQAPWDRQGGSRPHFQQCEGVSEPKRSPDLRRPANHPALERSRCAPGGYPWRQYRGADRSQPGPRRDRGGQGRTRRQDPCDRAHFRRCNVKGWSGTVDMSSDERVDEDIVDSPRILYDFHGCGLPDGHAQACDVSAAPRTLIYPFWQQGQWWRQPP